MGITKRSFGKSKEGQEVFLYEITNKNQVTLTVSDFGAAWVHMLVPDREGNRGDVVLGYDSAEGYYVNPGHFGAVVGRNGNRIGNARFEINGTEYQLPVNDNKNNLHSGPDWYRTRVWDVKEINEEKNSVTFGLFSPDGDQGFPGNFSVTVTYELTEENEVVDLPMIPLRGLSVFPNMVLHFDIGREKSINALEKAMIMDQHIFLASQKDDETDLPTPDDFYHIGTIGKIKQMLKLPGDSIRVLVEGICRGRIEDVLFEVPYFRCRVRKIEDEPVKEDDAEAEALMRTVLTSFDDYISINQSLAPEVFATVVSINEPGRMADMVASHLECKLEDKQTLLEILDPKERLEKLNTILLKEIEILNIEQDINSKVKSQINQNQREYYLREQMRAIQDELGVTEDLEDEIEGFRRKLEELQLEDKTREKIEKEISRFSKMQPSSAEATVSRSYIETVLELPWNTESEDNLDLNKAEEILNEDHYGLEKVKERVLEYLAVVQLSKGLKGPILCLVGPPGVGKT